MASDVIPVAGAAVAAPIIPFQGEGVRWDWDVSVACALRVVLHCWKEAFICSSISSGSDNLGAQFNILPNRVRLAPFGSTLQVVH